MTDQALRRYTEAALGPLATLTPARVHPSALTVLAVVPGIGAALAAAAGRPAAAVALWLLNRLLDGLDGVLARRRGAESELGAYLDILGDFVVYAAVPVGLAVGDGSRGAWIAAAVLLASFYVNAISWSYLSALLAARRGPARERGARTAVDMPPGLVEGAETVVFFAVALAVPAWVVPLFWVMSAAVGVTILQRVAWALRGLAR